MFMMLSLNVAGKELSLTSLKGMYVIQICSQVLVEAYERIGITAEINLVPAKRSLIMSNSGLSDGEVVRIKGTEKKYTNLVPIRPKICTTEVRVYVKQGKEFEVTGWESLRPYKIGIMRGHLYAVKGTQGMDAIQGNSNEALFGMLDKGRVDVVIAQVPDALHAISHLKLQGIVGLEPTIMSMPMYHFLHKKNSALVPEIERALDEMISEGRLTEINDLFISKLKAREAVGELDMHNDLDKSLFIAE